jgi:outer membrane protein assembly factor BamA
MWRRGYLLFTLACTVCVLLCSSPISAQISRRLDRCLPYPSLADEIDDMREEVRAKIAATAGAPAAPRTVVIDDVKFDGPTHLPDATRERLVAELKLRTFEADSGWLEEVQAVSIRSAWLDAGFFKVAPTATVQVISTDPAVQHVSLTVHLDEGLQYRLGDVGFRSSDPTSPLVFSNEELRKLLQMREGDLLSVDKIREALDAMKRLYGSHGFIDFVATPITYIDDERARVSLMIEVDQQKQFRVGKIEVFGLNPALEELLRSKLKPSDIFNNDLITNFLTENKSSLPPDVSSENIEFHRNVARGMVDLRFNFQTCPQLQQ